jgi:hypothetical protein
MSTWMSAVRELAMGREQMPAPTARIGRSGKWMRSKSGSPSGPVRVGDGPQESGA